jgi:hypothetical protein
MSVYDSALRLRLLNAVTAGLHLIWAVTFIVLWGVNKKKDLVYPLYTSFTTWTNSSAAIGGCSYGECPSPRAIAFGESVTVIPAWKDSGVELSLHWLVVSFFLLSALFQTLTAVIHGAISPPTIRFVEYSFSAAVMIVAIALQIGIMHTHTLLLLATVTWATMLCGLVTEKINAVIRGISYTHANEYKSLKDGSHLDGTNFDARAKCELRKVMIISHCIGWVLIIVAFAVLVSTFHQHSCDSPHGAPKFVWAIIYGEIGLFASFGVVQLLQIVGAIDTTQSEMGYVCLSFASKTLLGWLVYDGNFVQ